MKIWLCIERNPHHKLHFHEHEIQSSVPVQHMLSLLILKTAIRKYYIFALSSSTSINLHWCIMFIFAPKCIKYCLSCLKKRIALCVYVCVFSFQAPSVSFYLSFRWACAPFHLYAVMVTSALNFSPTPPTSTAYINLALQLDFTEGKTAQMNEAAEILWRRWSFDHEWHFGRALDWTDSTV